MKELVTILFFLIAATGKGQVCYLKKGLIIIAGESNSGGTAVNASLTAYELAPRTSTKILNNTTLTFHDLDIGTNNMIGHQPFADNIYHSLENGLANCADSLVGQPLYILKTGMGGTKINNWNDSLSLYGGANAWQQTKPRVDSAVKLMTTINGGIAPPLYLVWTIGINDAVALTDTTVWKDAVKTFFIKFRARYGNVPIFMLYIPPLVSAAYNRKILEIASEVSWFYPIRTDDAPLQDLYHWNYIGMKIIATRIIHIILDNYPLL